MPPTTFTGWTTAAATLAKFFCIFFNSYLHDLCHYRGDSPSGFFKRDKPKFLAAKNYVFNVDILIKHLKKTNITKINLGEHNFTAKDLYILALLELCIKNLTIDIANYFNPDDDDRFSNYNLIEMKSIFKTEIKKFYETLDTASEKKTGAIVAQGLGIKLMCDYLSKKSSVKNVDIITRFGLDDYTARIIVRVITTHKWSDTNDYDEGVTLLLHVSMRTDKTILYRMLQGFDRNGASLGRTRTNNESILAPKDYFDLLIKAYKETEVRKIP